MQSAILRTVRQLVTRTAQFVYTRLQRRRLFVLRLVFLLLPLWSSLLYFILAYVVPGSPTLIPISLLFAQHPLLVVAHPDDESLFFGPTILSLTQDQRKALTILVLSSGNNYGLGNTRKDELVRACDVLDARQCTVLDEKELQDNPKQWWSENVIMPIVQSWVDKVKADVVITFDAGGISGHINHRAVSSAIAHHASRDPTFPPTFLLRTVPTFIPPRKYIGILDLPLTSLGYTFRILESLVLRFSPIGQPKNFGGDHGYGYDHRGIVVSSWSTWYRNVKAFSKHGSQRSWDRWIYMLASRYMWVNEVVKAQRR